MTIQWGPEQKHDGSPECPADARDVACSVITGNNILRGNDGHFTGRAYNWQFVTAYRIPVAAPSMADELAEASFGLGVQWMADFMCANAANFGYDSKAICDAASAVLAKYRGTE